MKPMSFIYELLSTPDYSRLIEHFYANVFLYVLLVVPEHSGHTPEIGGALLCIKAARSVRPGRVVRGIAINSTRNRT